MWKVNRSPVLVRIVINMNYQFFSLSLCLSFFSSLFIWRAYLHYTSFLLFLLSLSLSEKESNISHRWNKHSIRFYPENPHSHIYTHTHIFISFVSIRRRRRRKKTAKDDEKEEADCHHHRKRLLGTWDKTLFCFVCVWWRINIYHEKDTGETEREKGDKRNATTNNTWSSVK